MPEGLSSDRDRNRTALLYQWREDDLDSYARICADSRVMRYIGSGRVNYTQTEEQIAKFMHHWEKQGFRL
jgi:RimJ/RimL family protein N-acetyltransferase